MSEEEQKNNKIPDFQNMLANDLVPEEFHNNEIPSNVSNSTYYILSRGEALNKEELYQMSAKEDINVVLVVGPPASGKTTLEVMIYCLFREGRNKELFFAGSKSLNGFKSRMEKMLYSSGEKTPEMERTSIQA